MLQAIKKTLAYAGIFNYPLTSKEIHHWLIGKQTSFKKVQTELKKLKIPKENFIERRKKNRIAIKKWSIAKKASRLLSKIPTILSILVTGNLSVNNSVVDDDIDLLIITKANTLWTTRFFTNLILDFLRIRRHPNDKQFKDKICLNMFLDEDHLKIEDQNIYTSHELLQAKPIYDKNRTYQKFISTNSWAKKYLPNAFSGLLGKSDSSGVADRVPSGAEGRRSDSPEVARRLFSFFEPLLSITQKQYMSSKITREKILPGQLLFHPKDTQQKILRKYKSLLTKPNSPYKIAVGSSE